MDDVCTITLAGVPVSLILNLILGWKVYAYRHDSRLQRERHGEMHERDRLDGRA